jgi:GDP-4-dehydro-6-deoxy-D-mannose reductase
MTLLITGAAGFLGRALTRAVLAAEPGARVVGMGPYLPGAPLADGVRYELGSAADAGRVAEVIRAHGVDAVAHLARAEHEVGIDAMMRSHVGNALGVLLGASRAGGVRRALFLGSAAEYGLVRESELPLAETHPLRPASPYGHAKLAETTLALHAPAQLGVPACVARVFNPVGPGQDTSFVCGVLVAQFSAMLRAGAPSPLRLGLLSPLRDFVDVQDVAEGLRLLLLHGRPGECYNVGSGKGTRVREIISLLEEVTGMHPPVESSQPTSTPDAAEHSVAAMDKLRAATSFVARVPLRDSLSAMLEAAGRAIPPTQG